MARLRLRCGAPREERREQHSQAQCQAEGKAAPCDATRFSTGEGQESRPTKAFHDSFPQRCHGARMGWSARRLATSSPTNRWLIGSNFKVLPSCQAILLTLTRVADRCAFISLSANFVLVLTAR